MSVFNLEHGSIREIWYTLVGNIGYSSRNEFFFKYIGSVWFEEVYIVQEDQKTIKNILIEIEKMKRIEIKLTLVKIRFSKANCKLIVKKNLLKLHNLDRDLIHFIDKLGELHAVKDFILIYILEHLIHNIESDNCGPFHLYFYEKLFSENAESQIFEQKKHDQSAFEQYFH